MKPWSFGGHPPLGIVDTTILKRISVTERKQPVLLLTTVFYKKNWANPGLFFIYFCLFKHTLQFLQQINVKIVMSIQYMVPGFELTTFET